MMCKPLISVSLCTFNRLEMLKMTMDSLLDQETGDLFEYEIVVVDDGSIDGTPEYLAALCGSMEKSIRCFRENRAGVAAARNRGVREARGEWIAFLDDDEIADRKWLYELYTAAKETGAHCLGGPCIPRAPEKYKNRMKGTCRALFSGADITGSRFIPGTGNAFVHRRVFDRVGLFDEKLRYHEDTDLFGRAKKAGCTISIAKNARIFHIIPENRLQSGYLRKFSHTGGRELAQFHFKERGTLLTAMNCTYRLSLIFKSLLFLLIAIIVHDEAGVMDHKCSIIFNGSYGKKCAGMFLRKIAGGWGS